jgi:hypothetical protein
VLDTAPLGAVASAFPLLREFEADRQPGHPNVQAGGGFPIPVP